MLFIYLLHSLLLIHCTVRFHQILMTLINLKLPGSALVLIPPFIFYDLYDQEIKIYQQKLLWVYSWLALLAYICMPI